MRLPFINTHYGYLPNMTLLILGLFLFLGAHSVRIIADDWRTQQITRWGLGRWKILIALISIVGLVLIVWGYGMSRTAPIVIWSPPFWIRHLTGMLTIFAFILLVAAYIPGNRLKAKIGHPMIVGTKLWAFAHLLANGNLDDIVLFGSFLIWAILDFRASRRRDKRAGTSYPTGRTSRDIITVIVGLVTWGAFAFFLHEQLIGMRPMG